MQVRRGRSPPLSALQAALRKSPASGSALDTPSGPTRSCSRCPQRRRTRPLPDTSSHEFVPRSPRSSEYERGSRPGLDDVTSSSPIARLSILSARIWFADPHGAGASPFLSGVRSVRLPIPGRSATVCASSRRDSGNHRAARGTAASGRRRRSSQAAFGTESVCSARSALAVAGGPPRDAHDFLPTEDVRLYRALPSDAPSLEEMEGAPA